MSSQDKLEKVLRDIHVLISHSEAYSPECIIVNKQEMFGLIDRLNVSIYEIMEDYELTRQSRDRAEREHKKQGEQIILDASRKAEDIYAASVMYTDEALNHVQAIMDESMEQLRQVQEMTLKGLEEKKQLVRTNQLELKAQLQDLVDTEKYLLLIEERNKEIEREKQKNDGRRFGHVKEKSQFADVKAEIHVNKEYFAKTGMVLEEEEGQPAADASLGAPSEEFLPMDDGFLEPDAPIDLSGASWDIDGLNEMPKTAAQEMDTGEKESGGLMRFFKKR